MHDLCKVELEKLSPEDWPMGYLGPGSQIVVWRSSVWDEPTTWTYHDDKIPGWRREWEADIAAKALAGANGTVEPSTATVEEAET